MAKPTDEQVAELHEWIADRYAQDAATCSFQNRLSKSRTAALRAVLDERDALRSENERLTREQDTLRLDIGQEQAQHQATERVLEQVRRKRDALRSEVERVEHERDGLQEALTLSRAEVERLKVERDEVDASRVEVHVGALARADLLAAERDLWQRRARAWKAAAKQAYFGLTGFPWVRLYREAFADGKRLTRERDEALRQTQMAESSRLDEQARLVRDNCRATDENNLLRAENERLRRVAEAARGLGFEGCGDTMLTPEERAVRDALAALEADGG